MSFNNNNNSIQQQVFGPFSGVNYGELSAQYGWEGIFKKWPVSLVSKESHSSSLGQLNGYPDVLCEIFQWMKVRDVPIIKRVCKLWNEVLTKRFNFKALSKESQTLKLIRAEYQLSNLKDKAQGIWIGSINTETLDEQFTSVSSKLSALRNRYLSAYYDKQLNVNKSGERRPEVQEEHPSEETPLIGSDWVSFTEDEELSVDSHFSDNVKKVKTTLSDVDAQTRFAYFCGCGCYALISALVIYSALYDQFFKTHESPPKTLYAEDLVKLGFDPHINTEEYHQWLINELNDAAHDSVYYGHLSYLLRIHIVVFTLMSALMGLCCWNMCSSGLNCFSPTRNNIIWCVLGYGFVIALSSLSVVTLLEA